MRKKKILIIRFSAIGDIVWTSPVVRAIKEQIEGAELHFATKKAYHSLLEANPHIDKIHLLEDKLSEFIGSLKAEDFDFVVDLHNNLRSRRIRWALGKKTFVYDKENFKKWLLVYFKINRLSGHVADRYMKAVAPLGVKDDGRGLEFFISKKNELNLKEVLPSGFLPTYDAFVIGASEFTKKLPMHKLTELCGLIPKPIVLIGGKEDAETGDVLVEKFGKEKIFNACGKFNIAQSAFLVKNAETVFGHDTGLTQIAAAFGKMVYMIFGSTHQSCGFYPYRTPHVIVSNENLSCRPCSRAGSKSCPKGHFKCMNDLDFSRVPKF